MKLQRLLILGDSYSTYEGHIPEGHAVYYSGHRAAAPDVSDVRLTWWGRLIEATGATLVRNDSWSGATICYRGYNGVDCSHSSSFIYRLESLLADGFFDEHPVDTVLVFGGTNDSWSEAPLGELSFLHTERGDLYAARPAIAHLSRRLSEIFPDARVAFIGNTDIKPEITEAQRLACVHDGHLYIPLKDIDQLEGHPTERGMAEICEQVLAALLAAEQAV